MSRTKRKFHEPGHESEFDDDFVERCRRGLAEVSRFDGEYIEPSQKRSRKRQARRAARREKEAFLEY